MTEKKFYNLQLKKENDSLSQHYIDTFYNNVLPYLCAVVLIIHQIIKQMEKGLKQ